jgi:hypothetical protein
LIAPLHTQPNTAAAAKSPMQTARVRSATELAALTSIGRPPQGDDPAVMRETAAKLLSQLFFAPLLAEARKNPFGADFANGGRTEAIFGEQLDMRVADAVANSGAGGVTAQLTRELTAWSTEGVLA